MTGRLPLPVGRGIEERRRHLDEIKRRVVAGTYRVDAAAVARAMLERFETDGRR